MKENYARLTVPCGGDGLQDCSDETILGFEMGAWRYMLAFAEETRVFLSYTLGPVITVGDLAVTASYIGLDPVRLAKLRVVVAPEEEGQEDYLLILTEEELSMTDSDSVSLEEVMRRGPSDAKVGAVPGFDCRGAQDLCVQKGDDCIACSAIYDFESNRYWDVGLDVQQGLGGYQCVTGTPSRYVDAKTYAVKVSPVGEVKVLPIPDTVFGATEKLMAVSQCAEHLKPNRVCGCDMGQAFAIGVYTTKKVVGRMPCTGKCLGRAAPGVLGRWTKAQVRVSGSKVFVPNDYPSVTYARVDDAVYAEDLVDKGLCALRLLKPDVRGLVGPFLQRPAIGSLLSMPESFFMGVETRSVERTRAGLWHVVFGGDDLDIGAEDPFVDVAHLGQYPAGSLGASLKRYPKGSTGADPTDLVGDRRDVTAGSVAGGMVPYGPLIAGFHSPESDYGAPAQDLAEQFAGLKEQVVNALPGIYVFSGGHVVIGGLRVKSTSTPVVVKLPVRVKVLLEDVKEVARVAEGFVVHEVHSAGLDRKSRIYDAFVLHASTVKMRVPDALEVGGGIDLGDGSLSRVYDAGNKVTSYRWSGLGGLVIRGVGYGEYPYLVFGRFVARLNDAYILHAGPFNASVLDFSVHGKGMFELVWVEDSYTWDCAHSDWEDSDL